MEAKYLIEYFKQSHDLYLVADKNGNIIEFNEGFQRALEVERKELVNSGAYIFIHPDDVDATSLILEKVIKDKLKNEQFTHRLITKNKKLKYISWNLTFLDEMECIVAVGHDVTSSSLTEDILKHTQDLGKIGSWQYDLETEELLWSDETYKIYELSQRGQISIKRISNFFREESLSHFNSCLDKAIKNAEAFDIELDIISGKFRPTKIRMIGLCEEHNGLVSKVYGSIQDITDFRQIQRQAADYKEAIDKSTIVSIVDRHGKISYVNEKFCEISKYSAQELKNMELSELSKDFHGTTFWPQILQKINHGEIWNGNIQSKTKEGNSFWVNTTIVPFKNASGKIYQYVSIMTDITEIKRLNEELVVSEKLSSIGEVSAQIIHEVMNPLSIISLSLEELEMQLDDINDGTAPFKKMESLLNNVNSSYTRIEEIFENMRTVLARKESKNIVEVNIENVVNKALSLVHTKLKSFKVKIDLEGISKEDFVLADESDLSQVFLNMINNACDAVCELDERWIKLSSNKVDAQTHIKVEDSGAGIPPEIAAKIFDTLFTTKGDKKGTGLGMGICQKLIKKVNGTIELVQDAPNTTFLIKLPNR